jgi:formate dehydrogenase major subunit
VAPRGGPRTGPARLPEGGRDRGARDGGGDDAVARPPGGRPDTARAEGGVWVSQEPWFEHPINQGSLCSKGAGARSTVTSAKRLRYPMKLEGGKWKRLSWDQAMSEIAAKLQDIRKRHGPDALHINFSAHMSNENGYAIRKWAAMWGTNNADFQARI